MKKLLLLFIALTTLANISYASFPILPLISIDTIIPDTNKIVVKETTSEYHYRMQKEGFDTDNCTCIDCRNNPSKSSKEVKVNSKPILVTLLIWIWILGIILGVLLIQWLIRGYNEFNSGPVIG